MADKDKIADPLEQMRESGTLGPRKPVTTTQAPLPPSAPKQERTSKQEETEGRKYYQPTSKHPDWKKQTLLLPPSLMTWLKIQAAMEGREMSEIAVDALETYKQLHPTKGT